MKKTLSILLAVILAFSAFTMVSFAEETEITEVTTGATDVPDGTTDTPENTIDMPTDIKDSMYVNWVDNHFNAYLSEIFAAKFTVFINEDETTFDMYIKDGKVAFDILYKLGLFTLKIKAIMDFNSEKIKVYFPSLPFFYINVNFDTTIDYSDELSNVMFDYSNYVLENTYYANHEGIEYYVEKMLDTEKNWDMYAYFKDGELVRVEYFVFDSNVAIMDISYEVSDKDVELPFYAFIDVTPLIDFFDSLLGLK